MSNKSGQDIAFRVSEFMYIIITGIAAFEAVSRFNTDKTEAGVMAMFAVVGIFMYFFRRKRRLQMEAKRKNK